MTHASNQVATINVSIPSLIDRASARLVEAKSSAEVLEAKAIAEMALHYSRVTKAANETHGDCLRIITRAEMRMANEIDVARERGEINSHGGDRSKRQASALEDLDLDHRRVAEWREVRDAGEEVVETAIQSAIAEGKAPTKADIRNHVRGTFGTGENEWYTPTEYLEAARAALGGFDLDPASNQQAQENVRAAKFFTKENDGLAHEWRGRIWLNPPYAQPHIANFVSKLVTEINNGNAKSAILLTHNYTDTTWFHEAQSASAAICFTRGRIRFVSSDGTLAAPTQGQAFFYYGPDRERFCDIFNQFGFVMGAI